MKKVGTILLSVEVLSLNQNQPNSNNIFVDRKVDNSLTTLLESEMDRINWVLNPFTIANQYFSEENQTRLCKVFVTALCIMYLIFFIPYIILHLSGEAANPFNWIVKK